MDKRALYKTAKVATNVFTNNGENDLQTGEFVGVAFIGERFNKMFNRPMAVYEVTSNGKFFGYLYEKALSDFVL